MLSYSVTMWQLLFFMSYIGSPFIANVVASLDSVVGEKQSHHLNQEGERTKFEDRRKYSSSSSTSVSSGSQLPQGFSYELQQSIAQRAKHEETRTEVDSNVMKTCQHFYEASSSSASTEPNSSEHDLPIRVVVKNANLNLAPINRLARFDIDFDKGGKVDLLNVVILCEYPLIIPERYS